jgi:hypothetical protein
LTGLTTVYKAQQAQIYMETAKSMSANSGAARSRVPSPEKLCRHWEALCAEFLPLKAQDSIWRFSRALTSADPEQGWKLHLSAIVLTAGRVLQKTGPLLRQHDVLFKAPTSLQELRKLNSGLHYDYSQVGKCFTIYPQNAQQATFLAEQLDKLTQRLVAPAVPYDLQLRPQSCVYYRYGSFKPTTLTNEDGTRLFAIKDPEGNLIPDLRDASQPEWAINPFSTARRRDKRVIASPLQSTFRAFRALAQRGKGGVYQALDLRATPPRMCILKEGRRGGEMAWDGRDGHWRVRHEEQVLTALHDAGIAAPLVFASFEVERNYYLVTEFIEGASLQDILQRRQRRLTVRQALSYGAELATLIARLHAAGWVWRDCKPANLIVTKSGRLRPLDFEGAFPVDDPDAAPWGSPSFTPPEWQAPPRGRSRAAEDLYALGAVLYLLMTARLPSTPHLAPPANLRRGLPSATGAAITQLLTQDPAQRPAAAVIAQILAADLEKLAGRG